MFLFVLDTETSRRNIFRYLYTYFKNIFWLYIESVRITFIIRGGGGGRRHCGNDVSIFGRKTTNFTGSAT